MSDLIIMTLTEKKLQESEEKYRNLFEKSSNAIVLLDITGKIIECNSATESVFGYSVEELIGKNYLELPYYSKRMLNTLIKRSQAISKKLDLEPQELEVKKKDGNIATIRTIISYIKLGNQDFFQVIIQDITEQKNAEQKLKESETKFRSILEAIPDIYFLLSKDSTVLEYRGKREDLYLEPEEFMGKKLIDILPSDLGKKTLEFVKKTITTKQPHSFEYELPIKNEIHYYEARYFYLSEERISCFVRDITERKKAEKEIYNLAKFPSEDPNPIMRVNNEKLLYINQSGKNLFNIIEGGKIPKQFKKILKQVLMENIIKKLEIEIMGKNYSFALIPIKQENYVNIYGQEITKRKKFENELLIEKKFSDDLINTSIDTIFVFNPQTGKAIRWNKAFNEISGYTDEEISSMKAPDSYYRKEDLIRAAQATKEVTKEGSTKVEMSLITKGGEKIPFEYSGTLMQDTEGNTLIMSIGRDITERKKFEMELKESEEKFRTIAEHSLVGISIIQDGIIKYFNKTLTEIDGYTEEDVKSWKPNEFQKVFHPEDREFVMEQARKKQRGDPDVIPQYQYRITRKDGKIRWIEIFSKTVTYKGRPADLAMTHDITDKVNAERLIKDSEEKFSKAFNSNALAMCITTFKEGIV
ncbi:MAG: PAS domain-containing protein, partial [Promethearchaeota archaeon]